MSVAFAVYHPGASWLHSLDPRVKLTAVGLGLIAGVLSRNFWLLATGLVLLHGLVLGCGIPWRRLAAVWRAIAPLLVLIVVLWPVFDQAGSRVLIDLGWYRLTAEAIGRGLIAATRIAAISFLVATWLLTTTERGLILSFTRLGVPHRWGVALAIGLRSIPGLAAIYTAVVAAQESRGLRLDGPLPHRFRAQLPILVATLVSVIRLAEQTAWALDARGFGGPARPTIRENLRMRPVDWLALTVMLGAGATVVLFGRQ